MPDVTVDSVLQYLQILTQRELIQHSLWPQTLHLKPLGNLILLRNEIHFSSVENIFSNSICVFGYSIIRNITHYFSMCKGDTPVKNIIKTSLKIYPNPAINNITIESMNSTIQNFVVSIKNIQGQEVLTHVTQEQFAHLNISFDKVL